ncbi:MAG: TRAP transporter large permease [Christensenellales bacterium]|jgi:C4-dicarboxylate transporter DctM subunit
MIGIVLLIFFALLIVGVPVAHVVFGAAGVGILSAGNNGTILAQQMVLGMNQYVILAVPFFIISGDLAAKGKTSQRLVDVINAFLGHLPGGLGIATIFASALFGAITGSAIACVVAIGSLMLPKLKENGYPMLLSLGIITTAGTIGVMIPPSVPMLQIAIAMGTSVGKQFMAGFLPGILTATLMSTYVVFAAKKAKMSVLPRMPFKQKIKTLKNSFWALMFPVIVLGSIYGGIATPTEAAIISVLYVMFVELFIYKTVPLKKLYMTMVNATVNAATLTLTIATAQVFVWYLTTENVPMMLYEWIIGFINNQYLLWFLLCALFFVVGCFTNVATVVLILGPMIKPILDYFAIDPIHFTIVAVMMSQVGFVTPPFGLTLFTSMKLANTGMKEVTKGSFPFLIIMLIATALLVAFPAISTFLPNLIYR